MALGLALTLIASVAFAASGIAQEPVPAVAIHGFASSSYGRTDFNRYLHGIKGGNYQDANLGLNISATVNELLRISAQSELVEDEEGVGQELDFAFAEWRLRGSLRLRVGKVKQPFGILSEVFDVGTLRPFADLPQAVYGPVGFVGEAYRGVGLVGAHALPNGWQLDYDVYAGGMSLEEYQSPEAFLRGEPVTAGNDTKHEITKDMVGGRVVLEVRSGLRFGASAYTGAEVGSNHRFVCGAHVEQLSERWSIRGEIAHEQATGDLLATGAYAEVAYRIGEHWQAAVQVDDLRTKLIGVDASSAPSLLDHREAAVGLNYWLGPSLVLKLAGHRVDGNRFAGPAPEDLDAAVASGSLRTRTNLLACSAQFAF